MTLGEKHNGNVSYLTKNRDINLAQTIDIQQQNNQQQTDTMASATANEKNSVINKHAAASGVVTIFSKQSEAIISFLRAARSGDLGKVLEFLESAQITDINACNASFRHREQGENSVL
ncbi:PREDICTED: uncharacterized protein LOC108977437 [Bactrocera latifrons]|uniref:uncharacterized protein LOC108977437 n=1 Tax=Bactrocera latifrons TaxID=174628 RepID=UPI0008DD4F66|nr:PREDICTED: uncharacterized protein LOC108977437 [Bactrocera latifrons]